MHEVRGTWFLAGLHSFGDSCQGPARPAVFAALSAYEDWISSLDWQVYFADEPEAEAETGSCRGNSSMCRCSLFFSPGSHLGGHCSDSARAALGREQRQTDRPTWTLGSRGLNFLGL